MWMNINTANALTYKNPISIQRSIQNLVSEFEQVENCYEKWVCRREMKV